MGFKQRGYKKETEQEKKRDYSLFAIACEGTEREPEYFRPFNGIDRIKVDIIENKIGERGSAPKKVLERALAYIEKVGLSEKDDDTLWLVIDVDKWPRKQIEDLAKFCNSYSNWNIVISNPCFEIWLLFHKKSNLTDLNCSSAHKTKQVLHNLDKGGYFYLSYLPLLEDAIRNAKANDTNIKNHFPNSRETKVYLLGEALIKRIGKPRFDKFIKEYLPSLKPKISSKKKSK